MSNIVVLFTLFVVIAYLASPAGKGWVGELMVTGMKKAFLDSNTYIDVNNVTIQTLNGTTQIDHIIVSKFGIFVIETKNMSGWIFGSSNQPQWTQSFPGGKKFKFQNPLHQNYKHTKSLEEFLGVNHDHIHSVVMFIGDAKLKSEMPSNVLVGGYISYIKSKTAIVFSEKEVSSIVNAIQTGMMVKGRHTREEHIQSLKTRHESIAGCPKCGSALILREPKLDSGQKRFYGCSSYPRCRFTRVLGSD